MVADPISLDTVIKDFKGASTENLFSADDQLKILQNQKPTVKKVTKKNLNEAIQYALMTGAEIELSKDTKNNFNKMLSHFNKYFGK